MDTIYEKLVMAEDAWRAEDFPRCLSLLNSARTEALTLKRADRISSINELLQRIEEEHYEHYIENGGLLH